MFIIAQPFDSLIIICYYIMIYNISFSIVSSNWQKIYQFLICGPLDLNILTWLHALFKVSFKSNGPHVRNWYIFYQFELIIERLYIYITYKYKFSIISSNWQKIYHDEECGPLILHTLTQSVCTCQNWSTFFVLIYFLSVRTDNRKIVKIYVQTFYYQFELI